MHWTFVPRTGLGRPPIGRALEARHRSKINVTMLLYHVSVCIVVSLPGIAVPLIDRIFERSVGLWDCRRHAVSVLSIHEGC